MSYWGRKLQEIARALCVAALVFLNFGHMPIAADVLASAPAFVASANACSNIGGEQPHEDHAPCRACRIAFGIILPSAPCVIEPGRGLTLPVQYTIEHPAIVLQSSWRAFAARAPPALV
jgi:hypothetical protein